LPRAQTLASCIEWEDFGHRWKIENLKPSELLPQGVERAKVWREEGLGAAPYEVGRVEGCADGAGNVELWIAPATPGRRYLLCLALLMDLEGWLPLPLFSGHDPVAIERESSRRG
jgi:hypothetical protein